MTGVSRFSKKIDESHPAIRKFCCAKLANGALAQLGEHLLCKQGVIGSIPIRSTNFRSIRSLSTRECLAVQSDELTSYREIHIRFHVASPSRV